ncbi:hypothetical protein [Anaerococcus senegalensis]|uniref:hypothetical protein n=1 Tax=Anaerococcus senegalensis TaxID=1288120 RepID=UPI00031EE702|nr:hypothetical protein [Anaerococcus senegalensis]
MKKQKLIIADLIAIIFTLITIYLPLFTNKITFLPIYLTYIFAYFAVIFSNQKDKKVLNFFIPLITLSLIIILLNKVDIYNINIIKKNLINIISQNYKLIVYIFALYFVERISTKIFGSYFTMGVGIISLSIFLVIFNTKYLDTIEKYKDYFFYIFVYFSFARIYPAKKINKYLYIIIILLFFVEILVIDKYKIFIGFHISLLLIIYLILKSNVYEINFEKYFLSGLIYLFPLVKILLDNFLKLSTPLLLIATGLIVFFLSIIFYQIKLGFFDYMFLGIHKKKNKGGVAE